MCPKKSSKIVKKTSKKRQKIAQTIFLAQIHAVPHVHLISRNLPCPILLNLKRKMIFQIGFETIVSLQEHVFSTIMQFCISFRPFSYTYKFCDTQARMAQTYIFTYCRTQTQKFPFGYWIQTEKNRENIKITLCVSQCWICYIQPCIAGQFFIVRCELYQIKSFEGIQLQQILVIGGLPVIQGCLSLCVSDL